MSQQSNILDYVRDKGFLPLRVEGSARRHESEGLLTLGSVDEYLEAIKVLGVKVVFVFAETFGESDFSSEDITDAEYLDRKYLTDDEDVDLAAFVPAIKDFRKYIGSACLYRLSADTGSSTLEYCIEPDWWESFVSAKEMAVGSAKEKIEMAMARDEEEMEKKGEKLLKLIRNLINDSEFVLLPTQKSMKAYALEKHPELLALDDRTIREEVQVLDRKIEARGLRKRRRGS
ncbi:MAG TPA: hypothetical protein VJR90_02755 [Gammaproteobacteria bacterium]|nr:hypothetical protein [Gammaproteobacteria bacterium]